MYVWKEDLQAKFLNHLKSLSIGVYNFSCTAKSAAIDYVQGGFIIQDYFSEKTAEELTHILSTTVDDMGKESTNAYEDVALIFYDGIEDQHSGAFFSFKKNLQPVTLKNSLW
ncbi:hypothetical protein TrispH2_004185 [Trichoplax sp. H2]|nr:hypothetical protein TrispH2_004185 [Trichoplax sp. H2]|eukprot:RDD43974.1 hypothetical protein TrispH2_004185 [Trichoplax sp. H2]